MTMADVVNLSIDMFIMVLYVNESFLIMLVYQDWIRTETTCNLKSDVVADLVLIKFRA